MARLSFLCDKLKQRRELTSSLRLFLATRQIKPAAPCLKLPRNLILCINKFEIIFFCVDIIYISECKEVSVSREVGTPTRTRVSPAYKFPWLMTNQT